MHSLHDTALELKIYPGALADGIASLPGELQLPCEAGAIMHALKEQLKKFPPWLFAVHYPASGASLFACDPVGARPLFYMEAKGKLLVAGSTAEINEQLPVEISHAAQAEFLAAGYTTGKETLKPGLFQLRAGEYLLFCRGRFSTGYYHRYLTRDFFTDKLEGLKTTLKNLLAEVFSQLVLELNGRHALVSLSGGLDSRLLVYGLQEAGYRNFSCFTYGRPGNPELENAERTCSRLGIPWIFINYLEEDLQDYLQTEEFEKFTAWMSNHSSMCFMQDYFAVKFLKEKGKIPADSVFLPGHSGDFLAGSHLSATLGKNLRMVDVAKEIFRRHFVLTELTRAARKKFIAPIVAQLEEGYAPHLQYEDWEIRGRQARFIVNSARVYEFFGYKYYLPLWDYRLIGFFKRVPFAFKLGMPLYKEALNEMFQARGLNFRHELAASGVLKLKHEFLLRLAWAFPRLKRFKKLPVNDPICYCEITAPMLAELRTGKHRPLHFFGYNGIIVQWYIRRLKGP